MTISRKQVLALALLPFLYASCARSMNKNKTNKQTMEVSQQEKQGILRAIDLYVEGGRKASGKIAAEAFSPTATMSWTEDGKLKSVPIQALFDGFDSWEPMEASYELTTLDVAEDVAIVRIESQFGPSKFADMFTLVKDGDVWKIVSKVYHVKK